MPPPERKPTYTETVLSPSGREWTVVNDPNAESDLTPEQETAMLHAAMERAERQFEQMRDEQP